MLGYSRERGLFEHIFMVYLIEHKFCSLDQFCSLDRPLPRHVLDLLTPQSAGSTTQFSHINI